MLETFVLIDKSGVHVVFYWGGGGEITLNWEERYQQLVKKSHYEECNAMQ
jgi:hypothetical protein